MSSWLRAGVAMKAVLATAVFAIIWYRVFLDHLAPMARNEYSGPFTEVVNVVDNFAVGVVLVLLFGTLVWFAVGGLQRERKRDIQRRRR